MIKNVLTAVGAVLMSIGLQAQNYGCATDEYINVLLGDEASRDAYLEQLAEFRCDCRSKIRIKGGCRICYSRGSSRDLQRL